MLLSYPTVIIDTITGYFASKPLSYLSVSNKEDFLNDLKHICYLNDSEDVDAEIAKKLLNLRKRHMNSIH